MADPSISHFDKALIDILHEVSNEDPDSIEDLNPRYRALRGTEERYTNFNRVGQGALKTVYQARDEMANRDIAYAVLNDELNFSYYDNFVYEAWLTASLSHPNIINIYDVGLDQDERPYFTMDLKSNYTYDRFIREVQSHKLIVDSFISICNAIIYAHDKSIIHLDLKPENIQCDVFGEVLICDWGLGRMLTDDTHIPCSDYNLEKKNSTLYGHIQGTPGYMSPEQILANDLYDERSDVFSLGAILYLAMEGRPAFPGDVETILVNTQESTLAPFSKCPASLQLIIKQALATNPDSRYQSVSELRQDLLRYASDHPVAAEKSNLLKTSQLYFKRNATTSAIILFSIIVISIIVLTLSSQLQSKKLEVNQLGDEISSVIHEYETFEAALIDSKQEMAQRLSDLATKKLYESLSLFEFQKSQDAVTPLDNSVILFEKALKLAPDNEHAYHHLVQAKMIQLDFEYIIAHLSHSENDVIKRYIQIAQQFPHYNFSAEHRPTGSQLVAFFNQLDCRTSTELQLAEAVLRYDHASRAQSKEDYTPVALACLTAINQYVDGFAITYNKEMHSIHLQTTNSSHLLSFFSPYRPPFLSFVDPHVQRLYVASSDTVYTSSLNHTRFEEIDLTQSASITCDADQISLPDTKTIRITKNAPQLEVIIRTLSQSNDALQIVIE